MDSEGSLIWGVLFGAVGAGYALYGKRQRNPIALIAGIALMVFPYFVPGVWWMLIVGAILMIVPWYVRS
jgi:hypothetical protein